MKRRDVLGALAGVAAMATAPVRGTLARSTTRPLNVLILGGTRFIGVHMTQCALDRGHRVTLFNRGKTNAGLFEQLEHLKGDRDNDLKALEGRTWDVVIDDSGYVPRHVRQSAQLLSKAVGQYLYISSISVYASLAQPADENSVVGTLADPTVETVNDETYGPLKALCEKEVLAAFPGRATILRPGVVVGPDDYTDRFTYWPARAARGGDLLAPDKPEDLVQFIDARDLAAFAITALERRTVGTFNVVSPPEMFTMGALVEASIAAANAQAQPPTPPRAVWVPADFLEQQKVAPWSDMPIWIPASGDTAAASRTSAARALRAGLRITPIHKTVHDTLEWHLRRPEAERFPLKAGLSPERERAVLAAWRSR